MPPYGYNPPPRKTHYMPYSHGPGYGNAWGVRENPNPPGSGKQPPSFGNAPRTRGVPDPHYTNNRARLALGGTNMGSFDGAASNFAFPPPPPWGRNRYGASKANPLDNFNLNNRLGDVNFTTANMKRTKKGNPVTTTWKRRLRNPHRTHTAKPPSYSYTGRGRVRQAMKAELHRMLGSLPSATTKSADPYAIDQWLETMQGGVGSIREGVEAVQDLMAQGVPEESYGVVSAAIGELLASLEEDEIAEAEGAYDEQDAAEAYAAGYQPEYAAGDDEGADEDDGAEYEGQYAYAGDDGMGEFKALSAGEDFDHAAQALAEEATSRTMQMLGAQPAIKSIGFQAPYFHTHAPHNDRLAHLKAFDQFIRKGEKGMDTMLFEHLKAVTEYTKASMQEDTDSEGGYLLPDEFSNDLIRALYNESWVRQTDYRKVSMSHKTLELPTVVASTRAVRKAEEAGVDQKEPTTGVVTFTATAVTQMSKVSRELLADSRIRIWEEILLPDYKQAFAEGENADFTVGTGSGEPQGCLYGSTLGVTTVSPTAFTADEVKGLFNALNHKYRNLPSTCWMMADATMGLIRLLKDGQGRYLINGDISKGEPETLLGKKVVINNGMPAATTGLKPILFGAFHYFGIADRQDMRIQRLEELYAVNRQVGFLADMRNDSRVLLGAAFMHLIMS